MRKLFAVSLLALLLGVGVVAIIETDPGYVLVSYGNYTLETSLWVGLVLLVLVLLAFYLVVRLLYRLVGGRQSLRSWFDDRRSGAAHRNTTRGVISYAEGNLEKARRQLLRGADNSDTPLVNYLLAARASEGLDERDTATKYFDAAVEAEPEAKPVVAIGRAEAALRAGEYQRALAALGPVRGQAARYPRVLRLQQEILEGLRDWDALAELLPELRRHGQHSEEELTQLARRIHGRRLVEANSTTAVHAAWHDLPTALKQDPDLLRLYVARQVDLGDDVGAERSILRALKRGWDPSLVRQYALLESDGAAGRLARAEGWLAEHPEDPELLLALGRLCLREKLWGKARDYFESCYRRQVSGEVCAELGRLLVGMGEPRVAAAYYREGLATHQSALPDLPMPDKIVADHQVIERH